MMNRLKITRRSFVWMLGLASIFSSSLSVADHDSISIRLSGGSSFQARNDVQTPNTDLGTRFSLFRAVGEGPVPAVRVELNWMVNERHGFRVLLAPLSYTESAIFDTPILFAGETFEANETLDATYKFNSWRIGYHYTVRQNDRSNLRVGATLKIRDAEIRLEQGNTTSFNDDLGVVPLLYIAGKRRLGNRWTIGADIDGLAGGPGRAIDVGLTVDFALSRHWNIGADVRVLDGGADVEEVYNFAQFNSAAIAISAGF